MIGIGSDHRGYKLKEKIKEYLTKQSYLVIDFGCFSEDPVDYPDIAKRVCESLLKGEIEKGILLCYTGIGMSIAANRFKGIRAALCFNEEVAKLSREHNDSNILVLPAGFLDEEKAIRIVSIWLNTPFSNEERHKKRIQKIDQMVERSF